MISGLLAVKGSSMLDYRKTGGDSDYPVYEYLIEGKQDESGKIVFDRNAMDGKMLDHPESVKYQRYASKLIGHLDRQMRETGSLRESGTYMWY